MVPGKPLEAILPLVYRVGMREETDEDCVFYTANISLQIKETLEMIITAARLVWQR